MPTLLRPALPLCAALAALAALAVTLPSAAGAANGASGCATQSGARVPSVVELYTSEGCSSCPPADRWLSGLKGQTDVLALAFHVDYWDRLGWKDRFSSAAYSQRQTQLLRTNGARYAYTPQVVVDGRDQPRWPGMVLPSARPAPTVQATLQREGGVYRAALRALPGAPARITGYWALSEDGHASRVNSGENRGATLRHDFVVREYQAIAAWEARDAAPVQLQFSPLHADATYPRRVALVLADADSGRVLQALALAC